MSDDRIAEMTVAGDWGALLASALNAMDASDEGRWCACAVPLLGDEGLMCRRCLLRNQGQYLARAHRICDAHDFEPAARCPILCRWCAFGPDVPQHHGVDHSLPRMPWEAK